MDRFPLFEISWEVAHRVGGIHTVVATKARSLVERFGDDYVIFGPWLREQHDPDAVLDPAPGYAAFEEECRSMGIPVRVGRWRVPGRPLTVLVEFSSQYDKKDAILAGLWTSHQVDSLRGDWGYVEPVVFGNAVGRVVELWFRAVVHGRHRAAVVQAHEWMCGGALLYLASHVPEIGTIFTTHATVIGRSAASRGRIGDAVLAGRTPAAVAAELGVPAKHSMESTAARVADVFTAVSEMTSGEALRFFGRAADPVLPNGLDPEVLAERVGDVSREEAGRRLRDLASRFLGEDVSDATLICAGARYEFHNKGLDVLIDAAGDLNDRDGPPIVVFLLVPAGNSGLKRAMTSRMAADEIEGEPLGVSMHNLFDPEQDPIAIRCREVGIDNAHGSRVRVVHWAEYVGPNDGVLNLRYEAALQGADATCFPSFYESWGYTPQESLALGVPTVTTDLAGFGQWCQAEGFGAEDGVHVLLRDGLPIAQIRANLGDILEALVAGDDDPDELADRCRAVAAATFWPELIDAYDTAHAAAHKIAMRRVGSGAARPARERFSLPVREPARNGQPHIYPLDVPTVVPDALAPLVEVSRNWWWSWNAAAIELFRDVDPETWDAGPQAPVRLLREVANERLAELAADAAFVQRVNDVAAQFRAYMDTPLDERAVSAFHPVAYICAEFGVHESFPIYSGGLGVLAGDHLRAASDLGVPLVAVGLLYRAGYMRQQLRAGVEQQAVPECVEPRDLPLDPVLGDDGEQLEVKLHLPGSEPRLRIWQTRVGRVTLYLLDADVVSNLPEDRELTRALYSGDQRMRIQQEIVLGMGGVRLLHAVGIRPSVFHINEGHGAFAALERVRGFLKHDGLTFDEAREVIRATTVFTTHTPVPAGHDEFAEDLVRRYFGDVEHWAGVPWERFMRLGVSSEAPGSFNMTGLAVRFASRVNGVSQKHGEVSRKLLHRFAPQLLVDEVPIHAVTNGVHLGIWTHPAVKRALGLAPGEVLRDQFERAGDLSDEALWELRTQLRADMRAALVRHLRRAFLAQADSPALLARIEERLRENVLYVGFARRFATYKRAGLIFSDPERLLNLLDDADRPVCLVIAGKAHPRDTQAQELIARIGRLARDPRFVGRIVMVENYDMGVARWLVSGVDVWLNNPRPPLEASGTSGMKAGANGVLNLSVGDGWWLEGYDGTNGWRIGGAGPFGTDEVLDAHDAASLYGLLEHEIVPMFYDRDDAGVPHRWVERVRRALVTLPREFSAARMVGDYRDWAYEPLAAEYAALRTDRYQEATARFGNVTRVRRAVRAVRILSASSGDVSTVRPGDTLEVGAEVDLDTLRPDEVLVEATLGRRTTDGSLTDIEAVALGYEGVGEDGRHRFAGRLPIARSGAFGYAVRVRPARDGGPAFYDSIVWA